MKSRPVSSKNVTRASAADRKTEQPVQRKSGAAGLPDNLKSGIEHLSGYSMNDVKVHYNSSRPATLQAHAYAQGTDIHLAPGQERHLPHEAWHVVQQKQGRVKPTKQRKGKTPLNDDTYLEREADRMGNKAEAGHAGSKTDTVTKSGNISADTVQAYSIRPEPERGMLYSVSNDESMVTGMQTPNHELYVNSASKINQMNVAAARGMIRFAAGKSQVLFGRNYLKVKAGFGKFETKEKDTKWYEKENHQVDMDKSYRKWVKKALKEQNMFKYREVLDVIMHAPWAKHFPDMKHSLGSLMHYLELFKKLVVVNQAREPYHDVVNDMEYCSRLVSLVESNVYAERANREQLDEAMVVLPNMVKAIRYTGLGEDELLMDALSDLEQRFKSFAEAFPPDHEINMIWLHRENFRWGMLESIKNDDPLFYRACDTMASTIMGNTVNDEPSKEQLKVYSAQTGGDFHFVPKMLTSGGDWVSMETFAVGPGHEREIYKHGSDTTTGLDNTWQYLMYGSLNPKGKLSGEDRYFELYTKLRYYLRNVKMEGEFRTDNRDNMTGRISEDLFVGLPGTDAHKSKTIWDRLRFNGVFGDLGEVVSPAYLETDYISIRLEEKDRHLADGISLRLKQAYATPRTNRRHIKNTQYNELKNVEAWIQLLKLPVDTFALDNKVSELIFSGEGGAKEGYEHALSQLIMAMSKKGKYEK